jgi:hypothetical protein
LAGNRSQSQLVSLVSCTGRTSWQGRRWRLDISIRSMRRSCSPRKSTIRGLLMASIRIPPPDVAPRSIPATGLGRRIYDIMKGLERLGLLDLADVRRRADDTDKC